MRIATSLGTNHRPLRQNYFAGLRSRGSRALYAHVASRTRSGNIQLAGRRGKLPLRQKGSVGEVRIQPRKRVGRAVPTPATVVERVRAVVVANQARNTVHELVDAGATVARARVDSGIGQGVRLVRGDRQRA